MLILPLLTAVTQGWAIGWASAPYDPHWAARYPKRAAWMAAAGPACNLLIAMGSFTLLKLGLLSRLVRRAARRELSHARGSGGG